MKKLAAVVILIAGLVAVGLRRHSTAAFLRANFTSILTHTRAEEKRLSSSQIDVEKLKLETLLRELDSIKSDYEQKLSEYKKLDREFTDLVMNSREHPNAALIKSRQALLDAHFEELSDALKQYQIKSKEIYQFQEESLEKSGV